MKKTEANNFYESKISTVVLFLSIFGELFAIGLIIYIFYGVEELHLEWMKLPLSMMFFSTLYIFTYIRNKV